MSSKLVRHLAGEARPWTSLKREDMPKVVALDAAGNPYSNAAAKGMVAESRERLKELRAMRKRSPPVRGRKSSGLTDFVIAGPSWGLGMDGIKAWARDSVRYVADGLGKGSKIAVATLHLDEAEPHVHILAVVADENDRMGWNRVRDRFNRTKRKLTGRFLMTAIQDGFHSAVSSKYGVERGERGVGKVHQPIDRDKSVLKRIDQAREEGRTAGEKKGRDAGHVKGLKEGRDLGHVAGRNEGHAAGRKEGHAEGRKEGYAEGHQVTDQLKLVFEAFWKLSRGARDVQVIANDLGILGFNLRYENLPGGEMRGTVVRAEPRVKSVRVTPGREARKTTGGRGTR